MAIIAALFAFGSRFVGKILTAALGWASTLLFGRVPASRQFLLLGITFGSIIWMVFLLGVVFPNVGTLLLEDRLGRSHSHCARCGIATLSRRGRQEAASPRTYLVGQTEIDRPGAERGGSSLRRHDYLAHIRIVTPRPPRSTPTRAGRAPTRSGRP